MQALFRTQDYRSFTSVLLRSRVRVLRQLEMADKFEDMLRAQGEINMLRVIEALPMQVDHDLQRMDEADERDRERQEHEKERPGVFSVR